jgi:voltage-gated potassium channel
LNPADKIELEDEERGEATLWEKVKKVSRQRAPRVVVVLAALFFVSSILILLFEKGFNMRVTSWWDAVWWTVVTLTTVGFGDVVPQTTGGRLVGIIVMLFGVGLVGIVTGRIASFLVEQKIKEERGLTSFKNLKDHFVVCGWKNEMDKALRAIVRVNREFPLDRILVLANVEPQRFENMKGVPELKGIRFMRGDFVEESVLNRANVQGASRVLVMADSSLQSRASEVDARTVMAVLTIKAISKDIYTCAELVDEKFARYLDMAGCEEILTSREFNRELVANVSGGSGLVQIMRSLFGAEEGSLSTRQVPQELVGAKFQDLRAHFEERGFMVIGLLENTGNLHTRKKRAIKDAQKTPDISKLVANLRDVKELRGNEPVINPGPDYRVKPYSRVISLRARQEEQVS